MSSTLESVSAAVEKADSYACSGIDQLTEKVPQLKDATPKLLEETKVSLVLSVTRTKCTKSVSTCSGLHHRGPEGHGRWRPCWSRRQARLRPLAVLGWAPEGEGECFSFSF